MPTCYANQLAQTLSHGFPTLMLLWGDDAGAITQAAQTVVKLYGVDPADPFDSEKIDIADMLAHPSKLPDSAATPSLMGGKRLIQITGISGEETGVAATNAVKALTEAIDTLLTLPLRDVLIILKVPGLLEAKSDIVATVQNASNGLGVRFFMPNARDISQWIQAELRTAGKSIEPDAIQILTDHLGADMEHTRREVEKLLLYVGDDAPITADHVRASLSGAIPNDVFRLAEAIGRRDVRQTDRLIQLMVDEGEDLNGAFMVAVRHLNSLKTAQSLRAAKENDDTVLMKSGKGRAPQSVKADFLNQVKAYPAARLANLPTYALDTLVTARSGVMDEALILSRALLALAV